MGEQCAQRFDCPRCRCILDAGHSGDHDQHCGQPVEILDALVIRTGDTLIVRVDPDSTQEDVLELKAAVMEYLPLLGNVMVIGCDQLAVFRPDTDVTNE